MPRRILSLFLVALIAATSGLTGAVACSHLGGTHTAAHGHSSHEAQSAHHHAAAHDAAVHDSDAHFAGELADRSGSERYGPSGTVDCEDCMHMHAHCCASLAVPAADCGLKLVWTPGATLSEEGPALSLGQLFYPLLRPPRTAA